VVERPITWIPRGSKKYLWDEEAVSMAVVYVLYEQGEPLA